MANNTIIAVHIWKAETRGKFLDEFGLGKENFNNVRNGMFVTKGIEEAFDNQQVCFLYNTLNEELCLWVADTTILSDKIEGSNPQKTLADVHQKPLCCPDKDHMPFRHLLAWHARLTLELRKESIQVPNYTSEYDLSPGRAGATMNPIARAINDVGRTWGGCLGVRKLKRCSAHDNSNDNTTKLTVLIGRVMVIADTSLITTVITAMVTTEVGGRMDTTFLLLHLQH
ncbi:expressed unknown protein [Seminavis robusta]|uniref:HNH nuclease domain-containing protein n=1 Tax=Seminavis robusta TaxID=568900 RepID=A0A9N8HEA1_9STRA|nr:expressed unknown protein [Seminavis robusta]|eukprot:Sro394_g133951.1  (227) ;mRNA; f:66620-67300